MATKNKLKKPIPDPSSTQPNSHSSNASDTSTNSTALSKSKGIVMRALAKIFGADYLEHYQIDKHIRYFTFLVFIGILYITNNNIADRKIRIINQLNKEIKELRSEYIITKSELMFLSKQSEVAKRVEPLGLKEPTQQPYLILNNDTTQEIF